MKSKSTTPRTNTSAIAVPPSMSESWFLCWSWAHSITGLSLPFVSFFVSELEGIMSLTFSLILCPRSNCRLPWMAMTFVPWISSGCAHRLALLNKSQCSLPPRLQRTFAMGDEATMEDIIQAAKQANAYNFIMDLPQVCSALESVWQNLIRKKIILLSLLACSNLCSSGRAED